MPTDGELRAVPLFPLPNVVLFPRAVLPLHIFEERYKRMTADAIAGDRRIAMALLRAGWEKFYYGRAEIEPAVCVGQILSHEKLDDGKYNFLLQGVLRARVVREERDPELPYRVAQLEPIEESEVLEIDLVDQRQRMMSLFDNEVFSQLPAVRQYRQLLNSPLSTAAVADLLAFNLIDDVGVKQSLLAEGDVQQRVRRIVSMVEDLCPMLEVAARRRSRTQSMN
jgi:uncharacterized protein